MTVATIEALAARLDSRSARRRVVRRALESDARAGRRRVRRRPFRRSRGRLRARGRRRVSGDGANRHDNNAGELAPFDLDLCTQFDRDDVIGRAEAAKKKWRQHAEVVAAIDANLAAWRELWAQDDA